jgi:hypothetical protein
MGAGEEFKGSFGRRFYARAFYIPAGHHYPTSLASHGQAFIMVGGINRNH